MITEETKSVAASPGCSTLQLQRNKCCTLFLLVSCLILPLSFLFPHFALVVQMGGCTEEQRMQILAQLQVLASQGDTQAAAGLSSLSGDMAAIVSSPPQVVFLDFVVDCHNILTASKSISCY